MSSDNFMAVLKEGNKYVGYHCSASVFEGTPCWRKCYSCQGSVAFTANTLEEAIEKCENFGYLEYGYRFIDSRLLSEPEEGFCDVCAHNPSLPEQGSRKAKSLGCNCKKIKVYNMVYGYELGDDCPVHFNIQWQKKVGLRGDMPEDPRERAVLEGHRLAEEHLVMPAIIAKLVDLPKEN